jgi:hypothetical protein
LRRTCSTATNAFGIPLEEFHGLTVIDHLLGNVDRRLAADEHDASPVPRDHSWQIMARRTHAAHDIELEDSQPVLIGQVGERLRPGGPKIVDENVCIRCLRNQ